MKHFYGHQIVFDENDQKIIRLKANNLIKSRSMKVDTMKTRMEIVSLNSNGLAKFILPSLGHLVSLKNINTDQRITTEYARQLSNRLEQESTDILGFVLENSNLPDIVNFFELAMQLKPKQNFDPVTVVYVSSKDLIRYMKEFLQAKTFDGIERTIEIFNPPQKHPIQIILTDDELDNVIYSATKPLILEKPFFTEIQLIVPRSEGSKVETFTLGKLHSVMGLFRNKRAQNKGMAVSSNSIFLSVKDIVAFKISLSQGSAFQGISLKANYIAKSKFVTEGLGIDFNTPKEIDFFRIGRMDSLRDLSWNEINEIELNLDTQQVMLHVQTSADSLHINNIRRLNLIKGEDSVTIHSIALRDSESSVERMQVYFAGVYSQMEAQLAAKKSLVEFKVLREKHIVAGDVMAHLVLSNMQMLEQIPWKIGCIGYGADEIRDPGSMVDYWNEQLQQLKENILSILDVSKTPNFAEHNMTNLTKKVRTFLDVQSLEEIQTGMLTPCIPELEKLVQHMDDFFQMDIHQMWDNETPKETGEENQLEEGENEEEDWKTFKLDSETRRLVAKNYHYFQKRGLVRKTIIQLKRLQFFLRHILPMAIQNRQEPDLILYTLYKEESKNYDYPELAYPAMSLESITKSDVFRPDKENDLSFIYFISALGQKVAAEAKKHKVSFILQYRNTLSELGYIYNEQLKKIKTELAILENPDNKEESYRLLLDKLKELYYNNLKDKENGIANLNKELEDIRKEIAREKAMLEKLLDQPIGEDKVEEVVNSIPQLLEEQKITLLNLAKNKSNSLLQLQQVFRSFFSITNHYYTKVLNYAVPYYKAQYTRQWLMKINEKRSQIKLIAIMDTKTLEEKMGEWKGQLIDQKLLIQLRKEVKTILEKLKIAVIEYRKLPIKDFLNEKDRIPPQEIFSYLQGQRDLLVQNLSKQQEYYLKFSSLEKEFYKNQEALIISEIQEMLTQKMLELGKLAMDAESIEQEITAFFDSVPSLPKEISKELNELRNRLTGKRNEFRESTMPENLEVITELAQIQALSEKRDNIHIAQKNLVNYLQGEKATESEIEMEKKDLEFLRKQEDSLEKVAMSKALPSAKALLKTQYLPQLESDIEDINRTTRFLNTIVNMGQNLITEFQKLFFHKPFGFQNFLFGAYSIGIERRGITITEKNIHRVYQKLSELYLKACSVAKNGSRKIGLQKLEIKNKEEIKERIKQNWDGEESDRCLYLPPFLNIIEVLDLCKYKDELFHSNVVSAASPVSGASGGNSSQLFAFVPKPRRSIHSLVLIYIQEIDFDQLIMDETLLNAYHQACVSNIFIRIDGKDIVNNQSSIFDASLKATFGACDDTMSKEILKNFSGV